ncbi:hypothetical protein GDO81_012101 [Engystomops pustulosus]|uniref:Uncharacterized protein n=1 Tax=Engystomops pustulosus TaxID=76066 RepID=A0AAV7BIZ9_ENGPU|nr:hypothetical protein GDO81_012101 [Engystomops pustulosus]
MAVFSGQFIIYMYPTCINEYRFCLVTRNLRLWQTSCVSLKLKWLFTSISTCKLRRSQVIQSGMWSKIKTLIKLMNVTPTHAV